MSIYIPAFFLFFAVISSGSIFCTACFGKRYESVLPVTVMSIVLLMYLFSVAGGLKAGFFSVLAVSLALYCAVIVRCIKRKSWSALAKNTFTPAFFVFAALAVFIFLAIFGTKAHSWDEFSCWADRVKVMYYFEKLPDAGTSSLYASYPPVMSLFQYLYVMINDLFGGNFAEWPLYAAYQIFAVSLFMPFFDRLSFKKWPMMFLAALGAYALPTFFFPSYANSTLYIDWFLALMFGFGLSMVYLGDPKDPFSTVSLSLAAAMLVLTKQAGTLLALLICVYFLLDRLFLPRTTGTSRRLWQTALPPACAAAAYFSWESFINSNIFDKDFSLSSDLSLSSLIAAFNGTGPEYRTSTVYNYSQALGRSDLSFGFLSVNILTMSAIVLVALYFAMRLRGACGKKGRLCMGMCAASLVIYSFALLLTYLFQFTESEALEITCFDRYSVILPCAIGMLAFAAAARALPDAKKNTAALVVAAFIIFTPYSPLLNVASGFNREYSQALRREYDRECQYVKETVSNESARIFLVDSDGDAQKYLYYRLEMRPYRMPLFTEHLWDITSNEIDAGERPVITAEGWRVILSEDFDYVYIASASDRFKSEYSSAFENPEEIRNGALYRVDPSTGTLCLFG